MVVELYMDEMGDGLSNYEQLLDFDGFSKLKTIKPNAQIGEGVTIAFGEDSNMQISVACEEISLADDQDAQALILRGDHRGEGDWLSLEFDLFPELTSLEIKLRYAPAERVYPRLYYSSGSSDLFSNPMDMDYVDLPDMEVDDSYTTLRFPMKYYIGSYIYPVKDIWALRLALQFPNRPWFALGIVSICQFGIEDG